MPQLMKNLKIKNDYRFLKVDICNFKLLENTLNKFKPSYIVNLAANSYRHNIESQRFF